MRKSRETELLKKDDGQVVAIGLSGNFCAEHEWGIKDLINLCGINPKKMGIDGRKIHNNQSMTLVKGKTHTYLYCGEGWAFTDITMIEYLDKHDEIHAPSKEDYMFQSAWSNRDFCIASKTPEGISVLEQMYQAVLKKDIVIYIGGSDINPFARASLVIAIASQLDNDIKDLMKVKDISNKELMKIDKKLNLKTQLHNLHKNNSNYIFAVSPHWITDRGHIQKNEVPISELTKYPIMYWINASKFHGWFTVEEIQEYIKKGTGAVVDAMQAKCS